MRGALDGRSNYNPIATSPPFTGEESAILADPSITDGVLYLRDGVLKSYNPANRDDVVLVDGDVTAIATGPKGLVYYATSDKKVRGTLRLAECQWFILWRICFIFSVFLCV